MCNCLLCLHCFCCLCYLLALMVYSSYCKHHPYHGGGERGSHIPARQDLITLGMGTVATRTTAESLPSAEVRPWSWAGGSLTGAGKLPERAPGKSLADPLLSRGGSQISP